MSRRSRHGRRPLADGMGAGLRIPDGEPIAVPATLVPAPVAPEPRATEPREAESESGPLRADASGWAEAPAVEGDAQRAASCTQAQLRRFIKSRPWIPMHELRRRFGIAGGDDDVTPVRTPSGTIFLGLPPAEGRLLGELLNGGDVGYELSLDPGAPIVVGVYPMRPVPRG